MNYNMMTSTDYPSLFDAMPFQFEDKGFMEMLGIQDFSAGNSLFDIFTPVDPPATSLVGDAEVINNVTPADSSVSAASSSSDAVDNKVSDAGDNGDHEDVEENPNLPEAQDKAKKQLKVGKRKNEKREKEARFAFMTKTEVDNLDDGYRWRKYGQKAVKNSPFPRSYYRCTTAACGVKKRVERSYEDHTIVVTTYEGQHSHPCPVVTRGSIGLNFSLPPPPPLTTPLSFLDQCSTATGSACGASSFMHHHQRQKLFPNNFVAIPTHPPFSFTSDSDTGIGTGTSISSAFLASSHSSSLMHPTQSKQNQGNMIVQNLLRAQCSVSLHHAHEDGLLQDIVPSQIRNQATAKDD